MPVTLVAPISENDYKAMQLLKLPTGFTGDAVTTLLNQAWQMIQGPGGTNQPLTSTANTHIYEFPSRYANMGPSQAVVLSPKYLPIISVTSVKWSANIQSQGWVSSSQYDTLTDTIRVYDSPYARGDVAMFQLVYTSGYGTIPDDLKMACGLMVAHLLSGGYFPTQTGTSVLPGWLPNDVRKIIASYKRVR